MNADPANRTKRPVGADRPFPWRCRHCGKREVIMGSASYDAEIRHDGRLHAFTIPQLRLPICQACGEKVFTEKVDDQITDALRSHLHLLTPDEMRAALERLNMTQKDAAERLGIAEATLSRWLTDTQIQSRAMDNLLRLFFEFPEVRAVLRGSQQDPNLGAKDTASTSSKNSRIGQTAIATVEIEPAVSNAPSGNINRIRKHFPHLQDAEKASSRARAFQIAPGVN